MTRRYCFAPGCHTGYGSYKAEKVSMFKVPKNQLNEWSAVIPRADKQLTIHDVLCEKHFLEEDVLREIVTDTYSYPLKVPRLRDNVKPSIWPNCPLFLSKNVAKKRRIIERHENVPPSKRKPSNANEDLESSSTSQECDETTSVNAISDEDIDTEDKQSKLHKLFDRLWKNKITPPSESWTVKFHNNNIIAIFETAATEGDIVIKKKIVLSKTFFNFFIFQHLHESLTEESTNKIDCVASFEKKLMDFDKINICYGLRVSDSLNIDLSGTQYRKDEFSKTVRHRNCKYVLNSKEPLRKYVNCCFMCENAKEHFIRKNTANLCEKNSISCQNRERRLAYRLGQVKEELQEDGEQITVKEEVQDDEERVTVKDEVQIEEEQITVKEEVLDEIEEIYISDGVHDDV